MEQAELKKLFIQELFKLDDAHEEYQDDETSFVIDSHKDGNTITITITMNNSDKKEFENWLKNIDDNLFTEVLDELAEKENLKNIEEIYNSPRYKEVISKVQAKTKEIAARKIQMLQNLL